MARSTLRKSGKSTRRARAATGQPRATTKKEQQVVKSAPKPLVVPERHWWQRTPKSERPQHEKLPSVFQITNHAYSLLARNWMPIAGITAVYGVLNLLLVRGLGTSINVSDLKTQFEQEPGSNGWSTSAHVLSSLFASSNSSTASAASSTYQSFLVVLVSLALVWSFRQLLSEHARHIRIRDTFYKSTYPLVPVLLVLLVIALQFIPMAVGSYIFSIVASSGIAIGTWEVVFWLVLFLVLAAWSLVWVVPSIIALYIATLPDMTPLTALRSAKKLVRFRRLTVLRKIVFLPLLVFIPLCLLMLFVIATVPVLAQWVFFGLSLLLLPAIHAYLYTLYRELLPHE
jgi:hypothetical protein